ncbi:hypothetical protein T484DRAFT_3368923 [Baffinella frigidus]|nr:hypothetical protein T484DRAFT_3368923 [Cryptophyta sp. CCMP2293]
MLQFAHACARFRSGWLEASAATRLKREENQRMCEIRRNSICGLVFGVWDSGFGG